MSRREPHVCPSIMRFSAIMALLRRFPGAASVALLLSATTAIAQPSGDFPVSLGGTTIGAVETITLAPDANDPSRFVLELVARFPSFAAALDRELNRRGNLNTCAQRVHWGGRTSIEGTGQRLRLRSRIGFEQWACGVFGDNIRIFGDARFIEWQLEISANRLDSLLLTARVTNIVGLPRWVEDALGLRFSQSLQISLLGSCEECGCVQDALDLGAVSTGFLRESAEVYATATFSAATDITTAVACFVATTTR